MFFCFDWSRVLTAVPATAFVSRLLSPAVLFMLRTCVLVQAQFNAVSNQRCFATKLISNANKILFHVMQRTWLASAQAHRKFNVVNLVDNHVLEYL
jgi:hypothetical protein